MSTDESDPPLTPEDRDRAVASLTELVAAIDAGEVESTDVERAYLAGARDAVQRGYP